VAAAITDEAWI